MSKKRSANWDKIREEYISNKDATYKILAKKYEVSFSYLTRLAAKEKWVEQRKQRWSAAEKKAIEEVEGSIKDLLVRHSKSARYLQVRALRIARNILDDLEVDLMQQLKPRETIALLNSVGRLIDTAWKAERELYPKHLKIESDVELQLAETSDELKEAMNEVLKRKLRARPRKSGKSKSVGRN